VRALLELHSAPIGHAVSADVVVANKIATAIGHEWSDGQVQPQCVFLVTKLMNSLVGDNSVELS